MDERQGVDKWGTYIEAKTTRGWQKIRRIRNGYEFKIKTPETDDYIRAIKATDVKLKLNLMSDRLEIEAPDGRCQPLSDIQESIIFNALNDYGMRDTGRMRRALHQGAAAKKYHPIKYYLESLKWDGKDHWGALINKLDITSSSGEIFIKKFLLGSIAKIYEYAQVYMLVLVSKQGVGKSRLARWFCPVPELFFEGAINPENKDSQIRLINYWLWEVAELDSTTRKSDRSALKHFITQQRVNVRVPYGRYDISKPATAAMIGTVNPDGTGFLNDPTGNRRFALVELDYIDWTYTDIDKDQFWAQLFQEYQNREPFELNREEVAIQSSLNLDHTEESPLEEILKENFIIEPENDDLFMPSMEILNYLEADGLRGDQGRLKYTLANTMTKLGVKKARRRMGGKQKHGYVGIKYKVLDLH